VETSEITHLVTVSCTGFSAPGFDIELCQQLGLPAGVARTQIGFMGCHGLLNALRVANAFVLNSQAVVLVCAVELCSLHQQYGGQADQIVSNSLFADGAAALVCRPAAAHSCHGPRLVSSESVIVPNTTDHMTWKIGNHGFEMTLSPKVPSVIRRQLKSFIDRWLRDHDLTSVDIDAWAVHPGGPRILDAVGESLELSHEALAASREVLYRYGNMSSPTVAFVLDRLGMMRSLDVCVLLGFGPGLTIEAALLR